MNFEIAIIGGSYAGMLCALMLANISPDLQVAVIEKDEIYQNVKSSDGRAYAISAASLQVFKEIKILHELGDVAGKICNIQISDNQSSKKSSFVLDFLGSEVGQADNYFLEFNEPVLGAIIENQFIFEALKKATLAQKNIKIFSPNSYKEIKFFDEDNKKNSIGDLQLKNNFESGKSDFAKLSIKLNNESVVSAKLALACDGRFSALRKSFGLPILEKNYHQTAIVCKIFHEFPHENIAFEEFFAGGPLAVLPLKNQNESSIVLIVPSKQAELLLTIDDENFMTQLSKKMPDILGKAKIISSKFSYPLNAVLAEKFYHHQMLLVGDAACGVHPIAGQGLNLAIANIKILRDLIKNNLHLGLDIAGDGLIKNYNNLARKNAKKMLFATDILNSLFETKNPAISVLRKIGLEAVNQMPFLKNFFIKNAGGS